MNLNLFFAYIYKIELLTHNREFGTQFHHLRIIFISLDFELYNHIQVSKAYNFCYSYNLAKLIRTTIGQFLKGNKIAPSIQNGGNYEHAQHLNVYNFCLS